MRNDECGTDLKHYKKLISNTQDQLLNQYQDQTYYIQSFRVVCTEILSLAAITLGVYLMKHAHITTHVNQESIDFWKLSLTILICLDLWLSDATLPWYNLMTSICWMVNVCGLVNETGHRVSDFISMAACLSKLTH